MEATNILVTGVGGGGVGESCMQALRLAKTKYRIIGTDSVIPSLGLFSADKGYQVPSANAENYTEKILEICKKEKVKALVTGSEPELMRLSTDRKILEENNVIPLFNTPEIISMCQDKEKTCEFLNKYGLDVPKSVTILEGTKLEDYDIPFDFPYIMKPARGGRTGGSRNAFIIQNQKELEFFCYYLQKQGVVPIIQEYIDSPDDEYTVGVLNTRDSGELIGVITIKRQIQLGISSLKKIKSYANDRTYVISSGISQGEILEDKIISDYSIKVAEKLKSRGPINIQCRKKGDKVCTFEINPRFSGTSAIRAVVGHNELDMYIRDTIFHEKLRNIKSYKTGYVLRGLRNEYYSYTDVDKIERMI